jgi:heme exporter protein A
MPGASRLTVCRLYNHIVMKSGLTASKSNSRDLAVTLDRVTRRFGRRVVFEDVSASVHSGGALVVTGPNGSGKSTLLRIIAGLLPPSKGAVSMTVSGSTLEPWQRRGRLGYVAPDLTLYGELSGAENLVFFGRLKGLQLKREDLIASLERVGLRGRGRDLVRDYSSGMRQRLKYAFALLGQPPVLLLDEPTANLDASGEEIVRSIIEDQRRTGLVIMGTNEASEVEWGDAVVRLGA